MDYKLLPDDPGLLYILECGVEAIEKDAVKLVAKMEGGAPEHDSALLRGAEVRSKLRISKSTLYKWVADGALPAPIKLGTRASAWRASEISAWMENR